MVTRVLQDGEPAKGSGWKVEGGEKHGGKLQRQLDLIARYFTRTSAGVFSCVLLKMLRSCLDLQDYEVDISVACK